MTAFVFHAIGWAIAPISTLVLALGGMGSAGDRPPSSFPRSLDAAMGETAVSSLLRTNQVRTDQGVDATKQVTPEDLCPPPVLDRMEQYPVQEGDTLDSIAAQYSLLPATLMGFNPQLMNGTVTPGMTLVIPPYNGIRVNAPSGTSWQDLSERYNVRADVLFEANGCAEVPSVVFIPGINWSPGGGTTLAAQAQELSGYPLPAIAPILRLYGWQPEPGQAALEFHSGIDLDTPVGTAVLSVGSGTVAFAGEQGSYGNLVVINHQQGLQTRYAQLATTSVTQGDTVEAGQAIGTAGNSGDAYAPHLHFEVRANSNLGWVAQDPSLYLEQFRILE